MQTRNVLKPFKNVCSERESHAVATGGWNFCNVFSPRSRTTMPIKWGSDLSFCSCTIWRLNFCIWRPFFSLIVANRRLGFSFFNFEPLKGITYTPSIHMPLNNFLLQAEAKPGWMKFYVICAKDTVLSFKLLLIKKKKRKKLKSFTQYQQLNNVFCLINAANVACWILHFYQ